MTRKRVRYAVVGLGYVAQAAVLPAFETARRNSQLVALVSGDRDKLARLCDLHDVEGYTYEQYDTLLQSGDVDAVYLALADEQHHALTLRAARAGVNVLVETPMASTVRECEEMMRVCAQNDVRLMVAYRHHFEDAHVKAWDLLHRGKLGAVRIFHSLHTMQVKSGDLRLNRGGGTLYDIGIGCINSARHVFDAEPVEVFGWTASTGETRFAEVEEMCCAILRFPGDRVANFTCSFGAAKQSMWSAVGTEGVLTLDPAYDLDEDLRHVLVLGGRRRERVFAARDPFAAELLHFSKCVQEGLEPLPSGREGLADVRVVQALYESAELGRPVRLPEKARRPTADTPPTPVEPPPAR